MNLRLPLQIEDGHLAYDEKMRQSINKHLEVLMSTPLGDVLCDPDYGFALTALRFENFNENDGTVYTQEKLPSDVYKKKLSGSSKNIQTFAAEFNSMLAEYEPRLQDTSVVMSYVNVERRIQITIKGTVRDLNIPYQYQTWLKVWS